VKEGAEVEALGAWVTALEAGSAHIPSSGSTSSMPGVFRVRPEPSPSSPPAWSRPIGGDLDALLDRVAHGRERDLDDRAVPGRRSSRPARRRDQEAAVQAARAPAGAARRACLCAAADDLSRALAAGRPTARGSASCWPRRWGASRRSRTRSVVRVTARCGGRLYDAPRHSLACHLGARGPVLTVSTACASGASALGLAPTSCAPNRAISSWPAGYDGLCRFVMRGSMRLRSLNARRIVRSTVAGVACCSARGPGAAPWSRRRSWRARPALARPTASPRADATHVAAPSAAPSAEQQATPATVERTNPLARERAQRIETSHDEAAEPS